MITLTLLLILFVVQPYTFTLSKKNIIKVEKFITDLIKMHDNLLFLIAKLKTKRRQNYFCTAGVQ